ncbi:MAG: hypothetical protein M1834_004227 [Cirrosporium novae-zelandiae]|nr:MAG: hypothetical protein M1834_004227 [Cirrosporium novae-zelandiae]
MQLKSVSYKAALLFASLTSAASLLEKRDVSNNDAICGCTTYVTTYWGEGTLVQPGPSATYMSSAAAAQQATDVAAHISAHIQASASANSPVVSTPKFMSTVMPTPGVYTMPATTMVLTAPTTITGNSVTTTYYPGTYAAPEATVTVVETDYVYYCPYATLSSSSSVASALAGSFVSVCTTPGVYTIPAQTIVLSAPTTITGPSTTATYLPGTYTAPETTITATETSYTYVCPYATVNSGSSVAAASAGSFVSVYPTPGVYTVPAKTIVISAPTTITGPSTTATYLPGTYTAAGTTITVTQTSYTYVCPYATASSGSSIAAASAGSFVSVCPTPGVYTIPARTIMLSAPTTITGPSTTATYLPGTYTAPGTTITVTQTSYTYVCPYVTATITGSGSIATSATSVNPTFMVVYPRPGTFTEPARTITLASPTTITAATATITYLPGTYKAAEKTITVIDTSYTYYCPYQTFTDAASAMTTSMATLASPSASSSKDSSPSASAASGAKASGSSTASDKTVYPVANPNVDRTDLSYLVPSKTCTLNYAEDPEEGTYAASIKFAMKYNQVTLEDSAYIISYSCSGTSITITFSSAEAFTTAQQWPQSELVLITNCATCNSNKERGVYMVQSYSADSESLTMVCQVATSSWPDVASTMEISYGNVVTGTEAAAPYSTIMTSYYSQSGTLTSTTYLTTITPIQISATTTTTSYGSSSGSATGSSATASGSSSASTSGTGSSSGSSVSSTGSASATNSDSSSSSSATATGTDSSSLASLTDSASATSTDADSSISSTNSASTTASEAGSTTTSTDSTDSTSATSTDMDSSTSSTDSASTTASETGSTTTSTDSTDSTSASSSTSSDSSSLTASTTSSTASSTALTAAEQQMYDEIMAGIVYNDDGYIQLYLGAMATQTPTIEVDDFKPDDADYQAELQAALAADLLDTPEIILDNTLTALASAADLDYAITDDDNVQETLPEGYSLYEGDDDTSASSTASSSDSASATATDSATSSDSTFATSTSITVATLVPEKRSFTPEKRFSLPSWLTTALDYLDDFLTDDLIDALCEICSDYSDLKDGYQAALALYQILHPSSSTYPPVTQADVYVTSTVTITVPANSLLASTSRGDKMYCVNCNLAVSSLKLEGVLIVVVDTKSVLGAAVTCTYSATSNLVMSLTTVTAYSSSIDVALSTLALSSLTATNIFTIAPKFIYGVGLSWQTDGAVTVQGGASMTLSNAKTTLDLKDSQGENPSSWQPAASVTYPSFTKAGRVVLTPYMKTSIEMSVVVFGTTMQNAAGITTQTTLGFDAEVLSSASTVSKRALLSNGTYFEERSMAANGTKFIDRSIAANGTYFNDRTMSKRSDSLFDIIDSRKSALAKRTSTCPAGGLKLVSTMETKNSMYFNGVSSAQTLKDQVYQFGSRCFTFSTSSSSTSTSTKTSSTSSSTSTKTSTTVTTTSTSTSTTSTKTSTSSTSTSTSSTSTSTSSSSSSSSSTTSTSTSTSSSASASSTTYCPAGVSDGYLTEGSTQYQMSCGHSMSYTTGSSGTFFASAGTAAGITSMAKCMDWCNSWGDTCQVAMWDSTQAFSCMLLSAAGTSSVSSTVAYAKKYTPYCPSGYSSGSITESGTAYTMNCGATTSYTSGSSGTYFASAGAPAGISTFTKCLDWCNSWGTYCMVAMWDSSQYYSCMLIRSEGTYSTSDHVAYAVRA